eukprot:CAMPEP_0198254178 /NCGR_PEP_ID=MMETSP1447-20131203/4538_1 /TAXON_ID=420782 /ORGANISM="Chaetoceros dichaeta, Strain CCMP1751" /LENGTH=134 /DNA_ID=CAMNT_0043940143 /DNA_START=293 /DNA_END=697 /DNA_ORIENTATION=-
MHLPHPRHHHTRKRSIGHSSSSSSLHMSSVDPDKMDTILTLEKIAELEQRLSIGRSTEYIPRPFTVPPNIESMTEEEIELYVEEERENVLLEWEEQQEEEEEDIQRQIRVLRDQLEVTTSTATTTIDFDDGDGD